MGIIVSGNMQGEASTVGLSSMIIPQQPKSQPEVVDISIKDILMGASGNMQGEASTVGLSSMITPKQVI
jgi:hypothetical protein